MVSVTTSSATFHNVTATASTSAGGPTSSTFRPTNTSTSFVGSLSQPEPIPRVGIGLVEHTPLGGNVPLAIKEKIWQGAYIDLSLLLQDSTAAVLARSDNN